MPRAVREPVTVALRLRDHVIGVVAAGLIGPVPFCLLFLLIMAFGAAGPLTLAEVLTTIIYTWMGIAIPSLAGATLLFTPLWPLTRRTGAGGVRACLAAGGVAGGALGVVMRSGDTTPARIAVPVAGGLIVGAIYCFVLARRRRRRLDGLAMTFG